MRRSAPVRGGGSVLSHVLWAVLAIALASSCAKDEGGERAQRAMPAQAVAPAADAGGGRGDAGASDGASAEDAGQHAPAPGFEPARRVSSDPGLAANAPSGEASAHWAGSGRDLGSKSPWRSLAYDGVHDRESDAVGLLQEPRSAFRGLPRSISGDYVDWVEALSSGAINPRARVSGQGAMEIRDDRVVFSDTKSMPYVTFPHRAHSEWLACGNCHDWLFKAQAGANDISMSMIARGRACGLCHGKVAFPPTECFRCHNGPRPKG